MGVALASTFVLAGSPVGEFTGVLLPVWSDSSYQITQMHQYLSFTVTAAFPLDALEALGADLSTDEQMEQFLATGRAQLWVWADSARVWTQAGAALAAGSQVPGAVSGPLRLDRRASLRNQETLMRAYFTLVLPAPVLTLMGCSVVWQITFPIPQTCSHHLSVQAAMSEIPHAY